MISRTILIIDDEADLTILLANFLSREHRVFTAVEGERGLRLFKNHRPHLVLLDVDLPGKSGIDVLREILDYDDKAVVIMLSGSPHLDLARETIKMGAVDYISKPFDFANLKDTLNKHLNGALKT